MCFCWSFLNANTVLHRNTVCSTTFYRFNFVDMELCTNFLKQRRFKKNSHFFASLKFESEFEFQFHFLFRFAFSGLALDHLDCTCFANRISFLFLSMYDCHGFSHPITPNSRSHYEETKLRTI